MRSATKLRTGKDPAYLAWLHELPCVVCIGGMDRLMTWLRPLQSAPIRQSSRTEAAHCGDRGMSQKAPDRTAIPLCCEHHREGRCSVHKMGKRFWEYWGIDRDALIAFLNERFDALKAR